ncbi:hypothetical protein [Labrys neptuniae]
MKLRVTLTITGPVKPEEHAEMVSILTGMDPEAVLACMAETTQCDPEVVIERTVEVVE